MYSKKWLNTELCYVFKKTNAKLCLALGSLSENSYIFDFSEFKKIKKIKQKRIHIFWIFWIQKVKKTNIWKPQKWEADLPIVIYVSKKTQSQTMYSKNLNTKLCIQKIQNYVLKNAKLCVCVPFLRILFLVWRPQKSSILNYISTQKSHQY